MNLYLLITAKKQIFTYFQYLVCLNKILESLNFRITYRGKKVWEKRLKFFTSEELFLIVFIFDDLAIFMSKDFLNL